MNKEMYTIIGVGVMLAAIMLTSQAAMRADIVDLRERVTRIEVTLGVPTADQVTAEQ